jgi:hypothetical protein
VPSILQGFTAHILNSGSCSSFYNYATAYIGGNTCSIQNDRVYILAESPSDPIEYTSKAGYRFEAEIKCPSKTKVTGENDYIQIVLNGGIAYIYIGDCSKGAPCFDMLSTDKNSYVFRGSAVRLAVADVFKSKNSFTASVTFVSTGTTNQYNASFGYINTTTLDMLLDGRAHPFDSAIRCNTSSTYYIHFLIYDPSLTKKIYYVASYDTSQMKITIGPGILVFSFPNFIKNQVKNGQVILAVMISTSNVVTSYEKVVYGLVFQGVLPAITDVSKLSDYINLGINVGKHKAIASIAL